MECKLVLRGHPQIHLVYNSGVFLFRGEEVETVVKIIHYYISSYFLRKLTEELPFGRIFFLFEATFIRTAGFAGYEFGNVHLVIICGSTNLVTPRVEFTSR